MDVNNEFIRIHAGVQRVWANPDRKGGWSSHPLLTVGVRPPTTTPPMLDFGATAFISILFLVDPPGTVPAFISLTAKYSPAKRRKTALVASLTATLTLAGFAAIGNYIFRVLGLTLPAFQIAGGFILFLVALDMIRADALTQEDPEEMKESEEAADVAVARSPSPCWPASTLQHRRGPDGAGPERRPGLPRLPRHRGHRHHHLCHAAPSPNRSSRRLGKTGIHILGACSGLVHTGIAVQFVLNGLTAAGLIARPKREAEVRGERSEFRGQRSEDKSWLSEASNSDL